MSTKEVFHLMVTVKLLDPFWTLLRDKKFVETLHDPISALDSANIVVTDTWISMGEEAQKQAKLKQFAGFQISQEMIKKSNIASNWKFMHCLPRHPEEVADDVFYSDNSIVFPEAENRLYAAISVLDAFVVNKGKII